jgi:hypothetical protein
MCFIWQSWGDHVDVAQAALVYVLFLLAVFVYCQFGERLSEQVRLIWLLQTDFTGPPQSLLLIEYTWMKRVLAGLTVIMNT